jgi:hypothetical protein
VLLRWIGCAYGGKEKSEVVDGKVERSFTKGYGRDEATQRNKKGGTKGKKGLWGKRREVMIM